VLKKELNTVLLVALKTMKNDEKNECKGNKGNKE